MSKEQRYTYYIDEFDEFDWAITDNTTDESYEYLEDITKVLNEQDQKIKELDKALELLKDKNNYYKFVNENNETIDVDLAISKAKEMLKDENKETC